MRALWSRPRHDVIAVTVSDRYSVLNRGRRLVGDKSLKRIKATPPLLVNDLTRYRQTTHDARYYDRQMSPQSSHRGARADYVPGRPGDDLARPCRFRPSQEQPTSVQVVEAVNHRATHLLRVTSQRRVAGDVVVAIWQCLK